MTKTRIVNRYHTAGSLYTLAWVSCGKKNCSNCPHGPYWYVSGVGPSGKTWKRYIGKKLTLHDEQKISAALKKEVQA